VQRGPPNYWVSWREFSAPCPTYEARMPRSQFTKRVRDSTPKQTEVVADGDVLRGAALHVRTRVKRTTNQMERARATERGEEDGMEEYVW